MSKKPVLVDLFCGCGGFGLGAELAGFHTIAAIDIDPTLQSAYKNNFPQTKVLNKDLAILDANGWRDILGQQKIDGVIGGPPCQGYSRIGIGDVSDPRRKLLEDFFRHVNILDPKFFVMENVEGLTDKHNLPQLKKALSIVNKKYTLIGPLIIDASDCGVPTKRRRVIIVGYDKSYFVSLSENHFRFTLPKVSVAEAIKDLPSPIPQSVLKNDFGFSEYPQSPGLSKYAQQMRSPAPEGLGLPEAIIEHKLGKVSGLFATNHSPVVAERYKKTAPGETDPVSRSKKLSWDGLCPTLRAGTGSDKGSFQSVRPLHPKESRVITVREAARLQGFPDWFTFHPTKWHSFRMIGNSVSPIVSRQILSVIYKQLSNPDLAKTQEE